MTEHDDIGLLFDRFMALTVRQNMKANRKKTIPGPWRAERHATLPSYTILGPNQNGDGLSELVAFGIAGELDARLMAAAPDLRANQNPTLLNEAAALLTDYHPDVANDLMDKAAAERVAIDKA